MDAYAKGLVVMLGAFTLIMVLLLVGVGYVSYKDNQAEKQSHVIFDKYVALAEKANGLSETELIKMKAEFEALGYYKVTIDVPQIDSVEDGEYPILVTLKRLNSDGGVSSSVVLHEVIHIKINN